MKSKLTKAFVAAFSSLPEHVQRVARKNYLLWLQDPQHPGLQFKRVGRNEPIYSIRVGKGWRALGVLRGGTIIWYWIGSHGEYDEKLGG